MAIEQKHHLYVKLLKPVGGLWRPVEGVKIDPGVFRIVSEMSDPENQEWEFVTGDTVRCNTHVFTDGSAGLVAVEKIS